jgi:hypothetical protein
MSVSCGLGLLSRLTDAPPILIEHLLRATGASDDAPRSTIAGFGTVPPV